MKRSAEALSLWGALALNGNAYAEASVRRIGVLARSDKEAAAGVLERIIEKRKV